MNGWQPIETAPKDGTEVLTWRGFRRGTLGHINIAAYGKSSYGENWLAKPMKIRINPTHWMPLPEAPK